MVNVGLLFVFKNSFLAYVVLFKSEFIYPYFKSVVPFSYITFIYIFIYIKHLE